ncbi:putative transcription factor MYB77, partial [Cocos nucifera]|nr:putative transcription factor MYB77 [Cocos nucifera]
FGNKWATIVCLLAGHTDNTVKNYWNAILKHRLASHSYPSNNDGDLNKQCYGMPSESDHDFSSRSDLMMALTLALSGYGLDLSEEMAAGVGGICLPLEMEGPIREIVRREVRGGG